MGVKFLDRLKRTTTARPETQAETTLERQRANRVAPVLSSQWEQELGVGQSWKPLSYGEYYPRSAAVYAALRLRQDAVVRAPLRVRRRLSARQATDANGPHRLEHPAGRPRRDEAAVAEARVQRLLDAPNPFWTRGDMWRATETYLGLWGSAYWGLERDDRIRRAGPPTGPVPAG